MMGVGHLEEVHGLPRLTLDPKTVEMIPSPAGGYEKRSRGPGYGVYWAYLRTVDILRDPLRGV